MTIETPLLTKEQEAFLRELIRWQVPLKILVQWLIEHKTERSTKQ